MGLAILYQVNPDLGRGVRLFRPSSMMGPEGEERSAPRSQFGRWVFLPQTMVELHKQY
jgi:hypothetical protein